MVALDISTARNANEAAVLELTSHWARWSKVAALAALLLLGAAAVAALNAANAAPRSRSWPWQARSSSPWSRWSRGSESAAPRNGGGSASARSTRCRARSSSWMLCSRAAPTCTSTLLTRRSLATLRTKPPPPSFDALAIFADPAAVAALDADAVAPKSTRVSVRHRDGTTIPAKLEVRVLPRDDGGRYVFGLLERHRRRRARDRPQAARQPHCSR